MQYSAFYHLDCWAMVQDIAKNKDASTVQNSIHVGVGQRIRNLRALRGISRKILSALANVSERHLAQVEAGTGNVSIRLLDQIAVALGVPAAELMSQPCATTPELRLMVELFSGLDTQQQKKAVDLIRSEFVCDVISQQHVTLVGLRGAGKTTIGRRLAAQFGVVFVSITDMIQQISGMPIAEIHALWGQVGYRRYEAQAVEHALGATSHSIIEAGGSVVANTAAFYRLLERSFVVWVHASPDEHMERVIGQGDLRPIEGREDAMDDLLLILQERNPLYSQAHARLDTSNASIDESCQKLRELTQPYLGVTMGMDK